MTSTTLILDGFLARPWRWEPLRRAIETKIGPASFHRYDSTGRIAFEQLGEDLANRVRAFDGEVNLVGFSMGGLVIRAARLIDPSLPIRRAVMMNSPHRGTWLACAVPTPGIRQMRPFDPFMRRFDAQPWDVPTLVVWNTLDGIVVPAHSTHWPRGDEHVRCGVPVHIWPIVSRGIRRRVVEFLARPVEAMTGAAPR